MARKTKAEMLAEQELSELEYKEDCIKNWFPRLMAVMTEADEVYVLDVNTFSIKMRGKFGAVQYDLPAQLMNDKNFLENMYTLEEFEEMITAKREAEELRRIQAVIRAQALAKLTNEEKVALGLVTK